MNLYKKYHLFALIFLTIFCPLVFAQSSKMEINDLKNEEAFETNNLKERNFKFLPNIVSRDQKKNSSFSNKKLLHLNKLVKARKYPHPKGKIIFDNDQDEYVVFDSRQNLTGIVNGTVSLVLKNSLSQAALKSLVESFGFNLIHYNEKSKVVIIKVKTGVDLESSLTNLKNDSNVNKANLDISTGLFKTQ